MRFSNMNSEVENRSPRRPSSERRRSHRRDLTANNNSESRYSSPDGNLRSAGKLRSGDQWQGVATGSASEGKNQDQVAPESWDARWHQVVVEGNAMISSDGLTVTGQEQTRVYTDLPLPVKSAAVIAIQCSFSEGGAISFGIARKRRIDRKRRTYTEREHSPSEFHVGRGDDSIGILLYRGLSCDIEVAGVREQPAVHPRLGGEEDVVV